MRQLLDVVHQAIQLPLRIDFDSSSQRESVELFVVPQIAEYRLHRGKASAIVRIPMKPTSDSNRKPATDSDTKPAT